MNVLVCAYESPLPVPVLVSVSHLGESLAPGQSPSYPPVVPDGHLHLPQRGYHVLGIVLVAVLRTLQPRRGWRRREPVDRSVLLVCHRQEPGLRRRRDGGGNRRSLLHRAHQLRQEDRPLCTDRRARRREARPALPRGDLLDARFELGKVNLGRGFRHPLDPRLRRRRRHLLADQVLQRGRRVPTQVIRPHTPLPRLPRQRSCAGPLVLELILEFLHV
mmetsp:Transcript_7448/g.33632  ORF Transcript_7448/g.33632 Transcript_7448/m.33632 type:complete len:218 (-) Transcript_7448:3236-3889(-)